MTLESKRMIRQVEQFLAQQPLHPPEGVPGRCVAEAFIKGASGEWIGLGPVTLDTELFESSVRTYHSSLLTGHTP